MNQVEFGIRRGTVGATVFMIASQICLGSVPASDKASYARPTVEVHPDQTSVPSGSMDWTLATSDLTLPEEADFRALAMGLVAAQEPLGEDLERVLALRFGDMLD